MIKISHEVPLDLLDNSPTFNDYDYCLPTYFLKYEKYREYFLKAREKGRFIILDNGLFEGDVFTDNQLFRIIEEVQPNIFIVPDAWNDMRLTKANAAKWKEEYYNKVPKTTELMVVLQGKNYLELQDLYTACYYRHHYTHFGFNHSSIAYDNVYPHSNPMISKMMGRIEVFKRMIVDDTLIKETGYHHFLGCSSPQEMYLLDNCSKKYINSVDTSNPILWGIKGIKYSDRIISKPKEKIDEFMEENLSEHYNDIIFNINEFKKLTHG
jgi:hypothetical protein